MARSGRGRKGRSSGAPGVIAGRSSCAPFTPAELDAIQARATKQFTAPAAPGERSDLGAAGAMFYEAEIHNRPPSLIGGVVGLPDKAMEASPGDFVKIVSTDKGPRIVHLQRPVDEEKVVIDYLSFTVDESILRRIAPDQKPFSDEEHCLVWAEYCKAALLRLDCKVSPSRVGMFGYEVAMRVGDYGMVMAGGKHTSLYVQFSGHAFACADSDFPARCSQFLQAARTANITRIDFAFDDFAGETFRVRDIPAMWKSGQFTMMRSPRPPRLEFRGDWTQDDPDQKGLTAYIGSRSSGKVIRAYEKGRELGSKESEWVRVELELRGDVYQLVPAMLEHPTSFFVMAAPALAAVEYSKSVNRIERVAREGVNTVERMLDVIRHQYGGHLQVLRDEFFSSDAELLERLCRVPSQIPPVLRKAINLSIALDQAAQGETLTAILESDQK